MDSATNPDKSSMAKSPRTRIVWLDIVRSIAIISITLNHAVNRSFSVYSGQQKEFLELPISISIVETTIATFSRIGVPLFLMITGALMLHRDYESKGRISRFLKHNWLQLFITTEIWLVIMFWYLQIFPESILRTEGIRECLIDFSMTLLFLNPVTMGNMWYMSMILCVYLMIPILAVALKRIDNLYIFVLPLAIVIFSNYMLPDINAIRTVLGFEERLVIDLAGYNIFSMYVVCILIGYFVVHHNVMGRIPTPLLTGLAAISFIAYCAFQLWFFSVDYDYVVGYSSIFPLITATFLFELLHRAQPGKKISKVSEKLSKMALGIYFVHICIMEGLVLLINHFHWNITYLPKLAFLELVSFFGSILIILICEKSELMKKYLFIIK